MARVDDGATVMAFSVDCAAATVAQLLDDGMAACWLCLMQPFGRVFSAVYLVAQHKRGRPREWLLMNGPRVVRDLNADDRASYAGIKNSTAPPCCTCTAITLYLP